MRFTSLLWVMLGQTTKLLCASVYKRGIGILSEICEGSELYRRQVLLFSFAMHYVILIFSIYFR